MLNFREFAKSVFADVDDTTSTSFSADPEIIVLIEKVASVIARARNNYEAIELDFIKETIMSYSASNPTIDIADETLNYTARRLVSANTFNDIVNAECRSIIGTIGAYCTIYNNILKEEEFMYENKAGINVTTISLATFSEGDVIKHLRQELKVPFEYGFHRFVSPITSNDKGTVVVALEFDNKNITVPTSATNNAGIEKLMNQYGMHREYVKEFYETIKKYKFTEEEVQNFYKINDVATKRHYDSIGLTTEAMQNIDRYKDFATFKNDSHSVIILDTDKIFKEMFQDKKTGTIPGDFEIVRVSGGLPVRQPDGSVATPPVIWNCTIYPRSNSSTAASSKIDLSALFTR